MLVLVPVVGNKESYTGEEDVIEVGLYLGNRGQDLQAAERVIKHWVKKKALLPAHLSTPNSEYKIIQKLTQPRGSISSGTSQLSHLQHNLILLLHA
jgi:hypothetical protein